MIKKLCIILATGFTNFQPAFAEEQPNIGKTTEETKLYGGPGQSFGAIKMLAPSTEFIIIPPKSVIIGKGVTIGKGVLIEGKPWHQIQLPDGSTGFITGNFICTATATVEGTIGLCPNAK